MGLRGACREAGGLRQAEDGLKSEGVFRIAPRYSFLPPINEPGSLAPVPPAAFAVSPPGHLVPRLPNPSRRVRVAWPRVLARRCPASY